MEPQFDPHRIVETLDRHEVDYLVVGGIAGRAFGAHRATSDVDCVIRFDHDNLARLATALRELGARIRAEGVDDETAKLLSVNLLDADFFAQNAQNNWMTDAGAVDVLVGIPGANGARVGYEQLLDRATSRTRDGLTVKVASLRDVIVSKQWADRPKDHEALPELLELAAGSHDPTSEVGREPGFEL